MAIKVDLLPTERKKYGFDIVIAIIVMLIAASVVVYWYIGEHFKQEVSKKSASLAAIEDEIKKEKAGLPEIEQLKKKNRELEQQIKTVKTLRYDPVRYSNLLDEISYLLPNNMWVNNVTIDPTKNTMTLTGVAVEQPGVRPLESISGFMKSVTSTKSQYFKTASISSTTRGTTTVGKSPYTSYGWTIEMTYDPNAAESGTSAEAEKAPGNPKNDSSGHGRS